MPHPGPNKQLLISLLGATGKTGRAILQILLTEKYQSYSINIYVRSTSKLFSLFPALPSYARVTIFEGAVTDIKLLTRCLSGAAIIFSVLGENENIPGLTVLQDAAQSAITSLTSLRKEHGHNWNPPRMILLSSSTWNPKFAADRPWIMHWLIKTAFCYPYADLVTAQSIYAENPELLNVFLVQPPALVESTAAGHIISEDSVSLAVSYTDLGAAFVELAVSEKYENLHAVGVSSRERNQIRYVPELLSRLVRGLLLLVGHKTKMAIAAIIRGWKSVY
jgi:hypothetical protein